MGSGGSCPCSPSRIGEKDSASRRPAATMAAPAPPTDPEPEAELTTIDSLPIELLTEEVFLRVPTPAALVRAAATKKSWRDAIADHDFLARYRKRHKWSPVLGIYEPAPFGGRGRPWFHKADSVRSPRDDDDDIWDCSRKRKRDDPYDAANRAATFGQVRRYQDHRLHDDHVFIPGPLHVHKDCRLLDCRNSRLLLTRGNEAMEVRSPLSRQTILLPFPPDVHLFPDYLDTCTCLLQGPDGSTFRVVYLQHHHYRPLVRAVEYDSTRKIKTWHAHSWYTLDDINIHHPWTPQKVMHAGHRIFCTYSRLTLITLMLDTSNMQFSLATLPSHNNFAIGEGEDNTCHNNFAIGEGEDNTCCFVESDCARHRLRVWQLHEQEDLAWDLIKDISMCQFLADQDTGFDGCMCHQDGFGCYHPRAISNGTALLCSTIINHHFVMDLNTCSVEDEFQFHGVFAYLMQMPWPPAFSCSPTTNGDARSPGRNPTVEGNMTVGSSVLASAGSDAPLQGSIGQPFSQQDKHDHTTVTPGFDRISDACELGRMPESITAQDTTMISQPDGRKAHPSALQHERGEEVNQDLEDVSASIQPLEKDQAHEDLTLQSASASISSSSKDRDRESAKKTSNEDTLEGLSQQVLCIKCGQDGELLTCSDCSLAAHGSCFGPSVTFEETDLFYCPVCYYTKAKERYLKEKKRFLEAKEKAVACIGAAQVSKQHDEQLNGVQPGAAKRDGHSNGCDLSKRNSIHQNETCDLAHRDEEPHQPRKKQKINAGGNGYPKETLTEKVSFQDSGPASMNKHSVLQNNRKTRVEDPEKKQQLGDKEARKETGKKRKRSVYRQKRYSNPLAPPGRRKMLKWTEEEVAVLREGMVKFTPKDDAPFPWARMLEYGRHVFNRTRLPLDLRDKWRNLMKADAGQ